MSFPDYLAMFRHYFPGINVPAVRECFKHRATPTEYRRYLERISAASKPIVFCPSVTFRYRD